MLGGGAGGGRAVRGGEVAGLGFLMQQDPLFRTPVGKVPWETEVTGEGQF